MPEKLNLNELRIIQAENNFYNSLGAFESVYKTPFVNFYNFVDKQNIQGNSRKSAEENLKNISIVCGLFKEKDLDGVSNFLMTEFQSKRDLLIEYPSLPEKPFSTFIQLYPFLHVYFKISLKKLNEDIETVVNSSLLFRLKGLAISNTRLNIGLLLEQSSQSHFANNVLELLLKQADLLKSVQNSEVVLT
jgi:hypothetical protein